MIDNGYSFLALHRQKGSELEVVLNDLSLHHIDMCINANGRMTS